MDLGWLPYQSWMNAAGTAGYAPGKAFMDAFPAASVFVTNPISYHARKPSRNRGVYDYDGGFLVHGGWPNPGFRTILQKNKTRWMRSELPIIVSLLIDSPEDTYQILEEIEEIDNIYAVEFSVSSHITYERIYENLNAGFGKLPIILKVPVERLNEDWLRSVDDTSVEAISLQAPRGIIKYQGKYIQGRLFGAASLPITMRAIKEAEKIALPILGGVGIENATLHQLDSMFELGLYAFQFSELAWIGIGI